MQFTVLAYRLKLTKKPFTMPFFSVGKKIEEERINIFEKVTIERHGRLYLSSSIYMHVYFLHTHVAFLLPVWHLLPWGMQK